MTAPGESLRFSQEVGSHRLVSSYQKGKGLAVPIHQETDFCPGEPEGLKKRLPLFLPAAPRVWAGGAVANPGSQPETCLPGPARWGCPRAGVLPRVSECPLPWLHWRWLQGAPGWVQRRRFHRSARACFWQWRSRVCSENGAGYKAEQLQDHSGVLSYCSRILCAGLTLVFQREQQLQ